MLYKQVLIIVMGIFIFLCVLDRHNELEINLDKYSFATIDNLLHFNHHTKPKSSHRSLQTNHNHYPIGPAEESDDECKNNNSEGNQVLCYPALEYHSKRREKPQKQSLVQLIAKAHVSLIYKLKDIIVLSTFFYNHTNKYHLDFNKQTAFDCRHTYLKKKTIPAVSNDRNSPDSPWC